MVKRKKSSDNVSLLGYLLGAVIMTFGLYSLVMGFVGQLDSPRWDNLVAMLYYLLGFVLIGLGKYAKERV